MAEKNASALGERDLYLFNEGTHCRLYEKMGAHRAEQGGRQGVHFAVWAPSARRVSVLGDFNGWDRTAHPLRSLGDSGVWQRFIPDVGEGALYKFHISGVQAEKADPYALRCEPPPRSASVVWNLDYEWGDAEWMSQRKTHNLQAAPWSIYEVHLGSWRRPPEESGRFLTYRETAEALVDYVRKMGYTHVEFLPVMEHPFYGSWGYQCLGYFAPSARYGTPQDFMYLIDILHRNGIGVILDWVPSHFPTDGHGFGLFDGTSLYEHADPRQGFHPDWKSLVFNYGRHEVRSFLLSSAIFWLDKYHADALRVDGVASMLYLDYSRKEGEWIPNKFGGRENLEAVSFLKQLNETVYRHYPDTQTIAEESTAWPMVSRPVYLGGLGFGFKWDMGWMHDTLDYMSKDPIYRKFHQGSLTFRMVYACHENFVLSLSHDEVTHGKGSLLGKMPGDGWQQFANLRLLYGYMYGELGKKLLFMGGEFGQRNEWDHEKSLDWHLLRHESHAGVQKWVADLNRFYREEPALYEVDSEPSGFEWVDSSDSDQSVVAFLRRDRSRSRCVLVVCNFTPTPRQAYRLGVPNGGMWREALNSDGREYWGSGLGNLGGKVAEAIPCHGRPYSLSLTLPPLSTMFFVPSAGA